MGRRMLESIRKIYQNEENFRATILAVVACVLLGTFVSRFSAVLWPFLTAIILASWLDGWLTNLRRVKIPRKVGAVAAVFLVVMVMVLGILVVSFILQRYILAYSHHLPRAIAYLSEWLPQAVQTLEKRLPISLDINEEQIRNFLVNSLGGLSEMFLKYAASLYAGAKSVVGFFSFLFFVPILTFYLLKDWPLLVSKTKQCLNRRIVAFADFALPRAKKALGRQIRGQLKVCSAVFVLYSTALAIIGVKPFLVLGFVSGLLTLVPFIGIFLAFIAAFIVAVSQGLGWVRIFSVAVLYFLGSSLESNFLTPKWVGKELGLHPIWMFFAVLFTLAWLGLAGAFFVMPLVTLSWSLLKSLGEWERHLRTVAEDQNRARV